MADYIPQDQAVRQFHIQVAIKLEEKAEELAFAPRQYTSAFHLPVFSQKNSKTQTSSQTCSTSTRTCPEWLFFLVKLKSELKETHYQSTEAIHNKTPVT
jgi:hypothetical protein